MNKRDAYNRERYLKSGMGKRYLRNRMKRFLSLTGFTLMELLIVIAIIGMLAAMIFPTLGKVRTRARTTKVIAELKTIELALMDYYTEYSGFPTNKDMKGLYKLAPPNEEYLDTPLLDAFNHNDIYQYYSCNDTGDFADSCIVFSVGPDKDDNGIAIDLDPFVAAHTDAYPNWPSVDQMPTSDNIYLIVPLSDIRYKK